MSTHCFYFKFLLQEDASEPHLGQENDNEHSEPQVDTENTPVEETDSSKMIEEMEAVDSGETIVKETETSEMIEEIEAVDNGETTATETVTSQTNDEIESVEQVNETMEVVNKEENENSSKSKEIFETNENKCEVVDEVSTSTMETTEIAIKVPDIVTVYAKLHFKILQAA